jgi:protoporphyrinogen oxidase
MANHVVVGAGAAGLYTAYRLLKDGNLPEGDTVRLYEWSHRPGGRIYTYKFPADVGGPDGLYCEVGGMRFAIDEKFPHETVEGHRMVQNVIISAFKTRSFRLGSLRIGSITFAESISLEAN